MAMLPMILSTDCWGRITHRVEVREDLIYDRVGCVPCKGTGREWYMTGGGLWSQEWTGFRCPHCYGAGIVSIPTAA